MTKITENEIELFAIELLEKQGFSYIYAPNIAPDSETPVRESFEDVILKEKLTNSLNTMNPSLEYDQIEYAVKQIERLKTTELLTDNETFHKMLTEGITVEVQKKSVTRGEIVKLIDFDDISNNDFVVSNQFTIIDKPMKGHNLMQAIARVNRVYLDKPAGLVVDYLGIASDLKKALSFYSDSGGKGDPALAQEQAVALMLEKLEVVSQMYHDFEYENYFEADTRVKLSLILEAQEHILGLEDGKKRYIDEVTALSQAFAIAVPHDEAMDVKDEISFFQAVKAH